MSETLQLQQRVTQTRLHSESVNGNCISACLASVFGGTCEDFHDRIRLNDAWWSDVEAIFAERGLLVLRLSASEGKPRGVCFASGVSPRGIRHLCVAVDGEIAHDPHPSRAGLAEISDYWVAVPWVFDTWAFEPAVSREEAYGSDVILTSNATTTEAP